MKQFLIKNWVTLVFMGILAFFYFDKAQDSKDKTRIIEHIMETHEMDKDTIDKKIEILEDLVNGSHERINIMDSSNKDLVIQINKIRYEKNKSNLDIPTYADRKLDSIIANHRHTRSQ